MNATAANAATSPVHPHPLAPSAAAAIPKSAGAATATAALAYRDTPSAAAAAIATHAANAAPRTRSGAATTTVTAASAAPSSTASYGAPSARANGVVARSHATSVTSRSRLPLCAAYRRAIPIAGTGERVDTKKAAEHSAAARAARNAYRSSVVMRFDTRAHGRQHKHVRLTAFVVRESAKNSNSASSRVSARIVVITMQQQQQALVDRDAVRRAESILAAHGHPDDGFERSATGAWSTTIANATEACRVELRGAGLEISEVPSHPDRLRVTVRTPRVQWRLGRAAELAIVVGVAIVAAAAVAYVSATRRAENVDAGEHGIL